MASTGSEVRIAMRDRYYNEHCWIQNAALKPGLDLIPSYENSKKVVVVDYGCSQGNNSIEALQKVISTLPSGATAHLLFEDTPYNDFTSLGLTISKHFSPSSTPKGIFIAPAMIPIGFYNQVTPTAHADLGLSWSSLNYLENSPNIALDATASPAEFIAARQKALASAGATDFIKLLKLRAQEIRPGGYFIAAIGGQKPEGDSRPGNQGFQPLQAAMMKMLKTGKLSMAEMGATALWPAHERTLEEVKVGLDAVKGLWDVEHVDAQLIVHPSWGTYQDALAGAGEDQGKKDEAARKYAYETLVNLLSSSGWFWIETLKKFRGEEWDGDAWIDELLALAVEEMLASETMRNAKVEMWYNYIKLKRSDVAVEE